MGVEFNTIPARTLIHVNGIEGPLRLEDQMSSRVLADWLETHTDPDYPEILYNSFQRFHKNKVSMFPLLNFWMCRKQQKDEDPEGKFGRVYQELPGVVKALQRKIFIVGIELEGQTLSFFCR